MKRTRLSKKSDCYDELLVMRKDERDYLPCTKYLLRHPQLNEHTRLYAVDWMFKTGAKMKLSRESVYTGINFFDRALSNLSDYKLEDVDLLCTTCLWMGAKLEEVDVVYIQHFVAENDGRHINSANMESTEISLLRPLEFRFIPRTVYTFIDFYMYQLEGADRDPAVFNQLMEVVDYAMLDIKILEFLPSVVAATAILAMTKYTEDQVLDLFTLKSVQLAGCIEWFKILFLVRVRAAPYLPATPCWSRQQYNKDSHNQIRFADNRYNSLKQSYSWV